MTEPTLSGALDAIRRGAGPRDDSAPAPTAPAGPGDLWTGPASGPSARPGPSGPQYGQHGQPGQPAGTYTDSGGHVRPVPANGGYGEAYAAGADSGALPGGTGGQPPGGTGPVPGPAPARRRRRGRILAIVVVVLLVLFVVGDRVAVAVAKDQMVKQIEISVAASIEPGATPPTVRNVTIGGFPFLTQVLFGKFKDIGVTIEGIPTPGPRISQVHANLKGLHVPLGDALSDKIGEVPVDDVRATVRISYDDLNAYLAKQDPPVQVTPVDGGDRVEISSRIDTGILGSQEIGGVTTFEVQDNALTLVPSEISLKGPINANIPLPAGLRLDSIPIPVAGLPFKLNIVAASTDGTGLSLTATAKDVILPAAPEPTGGQ